MKPTSRLFVVLGLVPVPEAGNGGHAEVLQLDDLLLQADRVEGPVLGGLLHCRPRVHLPLLLLLVLQQADSNTFHSAYSRKDSKEENRFTSDIAFLIVCVCMFVIWHFFRIFLLLLSMILCAFVFVIVFKVRSQDFSRYSVSLQLQLRLILKRSAQ